MNALLEKIYTLYGLGAHSPKKVTKGFLSENHIFFAEGVKYFLKRYRFNDEHRIQEIHAVKKYFADHSLSIIIPVATKSGDTYFLFNDGIFTVFPFIEDKEYEIGTLSNTAIISLGETLARLHIVGKTAKVPIQRRSESWDKKKMLEKIYAIQGVIQTITHPSDFDMLARKNLDLKQDVIFRDKTIFEELDIPDDHLIHGDYIVSNVFFDTYDQVSYIFDFEKCTYASRIFEVFRSCMYSFFYS